MATTNAYIEYTADGNTHRMPLYVDTVAQPLMISGSSVQGRTSRQFYPRAHAPGDIAVTGRCLTQTALQELGLFIRTHHRTIINTPESIMFNRVDTNSTGYRRLLKLWVRHEGILVRGLIPRFTVNKKGVFEPAPQYTFNFIVIFDPAAENINVSSTIRKYYNNADNYSSNKAIELVDPVGQGHVSRAEGTG